MALIEAIVGPVSKLLDKIIPDPQARDRAKLELIKLQGDQEMAAIGRQMQAIAAEAQIARSLDQPGPAELPLCHVRDDPLGHPDGADRCGPPANGAWH